MIPEMIVQSDLSKPVYEEIKKMIESGALKPGQKLLQEELAEKLGVSRTPLMKALQTLEHELFVESKPRRGMYVKNVSFEEMIDVYDCREGIECTAVRLVIERASKKEIGLFYKVFAPFLNQIPIDIEKYSLADERFHDLLIELAKNPILKKMSSVSSIHKRVYLFGLLRSPDETIKEHLDIISAIEKRDINAAVQAVKKHIDYSKQILITKKENQQ